MFNDLTTPATLMATRRSGKPRDMAAPGPDDAQLARILAAATRVPDHGKLAPWRFLVVPPAARAVLGERMAGCLRAERPDAHEAELAAARDFALQAPTLVVVLFSPRESAKIPLWEQELSAGAACMALLVAAHAEGFVGGWLTTWAAYSDRVRDLFGHAPERIAGFMFLGSPGRELSERPRPDPEQVIGVWHP